MSWHGVIAQYRDWIPIDSTATSITLFEGNTPLIEAPRLAAHLGVSANIFLKCEGLNPTGSFKDRGMTVAVTAAAATGRQTLICASTGNTSASAAAYAARAGLQAVVVVPAGRISPAKLSQAVMHGAKIVAVDGSFDDALSIVRTLGEDESVTVVNSVNPFRLHGQKTAAFEICDVLGQPPDYHFLPVGNAGNITAYWMGYSEYRTAGMIEHTPRMMGFQAAGAAPIVRGYRVENPNTIATAIRIGDPASWTEALRARDESGGVIDEVTDREIIDAYRLLAECEGVFVEPASAASVAGLKRVNERDDIEPGTVVVCTLTGHGLKDPATATEISPAPIQTAADVDRVREAIWP